MARLRVHMCSVGLVLLLATAGCSSGDAKTGDGSTSAGGGAAAPLPPASPPGGYDVPPVQGDVRTKTDPASTFALDVDTAAYGYTRRVLADGQLPEPSSVRPEEFVNALPQDYPEPAGDGFSVSVDGARADTFGEYGEHGSHIVRVGLQTRRQDSETRPDAALTFVIDVSSSMAEPGRLDLVKDAMRTLVDQLRPTDSVAIVTFSDEAEVVQPMTPVRERADLHAAVDRLVTEGSTNLEAGLVLGYDTARAGFREGASNRVVLLSDALANVGSTTAEPILARVREQAGKGIALLGGGVGSEYGDALMEQLTDQGDGFTAYVSELGEARRLFVERLPATLQVRALDAKAQVRFDPEEVLSYRLIGFDNRAVADEDFRDDAVDGGEVGPGHTVTALYVVQLATGGGLDDEIGQVDVHWVDPASRSPRDAVRPIRTSDIERSGEDASAWLTADVTAARLAEALRDGRGDLSGLAGEAARVAGRLENPDVVALADMARRAADLAGSGLPR